MAIDFAAESVEELCEKFGDKFEVFLRNEKNKRFNQVYNVSIKKLIENIGKDSANAELIKKNLAKMQKSLGQLKTNSTVNTLIGVGNLCATAVGFAIVMDELNSISKQIDENKVLMQTINQDYVFDKFERVLKDHMAMLDGRKGGIAFDEVGYRKLIDDEQSTLVLLYKTFINQSCVNRLEVFQASVTLAEMLSQTIFYFDSIYYFNHDKVNDFYSGHESWLSIYELLTNSIFVDTLQDLFFLEKGYHQQQTDYLIDELIGGFKNNLNRIIRNDDVIKHAKTLDNYNLILNYIDIKSQEEINNYLRENDINDEMIVDMLNTINKEQAMMYQG